MLSLLSTQKPPVSHARSHTLDDTPVIYPGHVIDTVTGLQEQSSPLDLPAPISRQAVLAEPGRTHQRSLTECDPISRDRLPPSTSTGDRHQIRAPLTTGFDFGFSQSPLEPSRQESPARNSTRSTSPKRDTKVTKVASWFQGESEPIKVGFLPSPSKETFGSPENMPSPPTSKNAVHQRAATTMPSIRPAMASRFSFFTSKAASSKSTTPVADANDEFLSMDPNAALFPAGQPDPFSPAGFKNLQQQAEGLLTRLQKAYKERTQALRELTAEKEALNEETQGAETRAQHLKLQLDEMAAKLAEQDGVMMNLVDELAQEKMARREEEEVRKCSVRLVEQDTQLPTMTLATRTSHGRTSSSNTVSDSGFESEDESCSADSVFSRRNTMHSPTMSMSSVSTTNSPELSQPSTDFGSQPHQTPRLRAQQISYKAGYQHRNALVTRDAVRPPLACANCNGVPSTEAWSVVSILKEENHCLKHRLQELEGALDGALDMVGGLSG